MNEKIKEFEKQCTEYYSNGRIRGFDLDKFAELIVKECIEVIEKQKAKMSYGPTFVIEDIKQHFGVEE